MRRIAGDIVTRQLCAISPSPVGGFSLIELMVALIIASIMLAIGIPGFSAVIRSQRIATSTNDFFMAINLTRAEAIRRGRRVDLAPLEGSDWAKGWVVFVDKNNNQMADAGDEIVFTHDAVTAGMTIKSVLTDSKPYIAYGAAGRTRTNANSQTPQFGTVTFKLDEEIRRIKLNFLGRPRSCNPQNDNTCTGSTDTN